MPLPVAVEITPLDAPREQIQVLLDACSTALEEARCVVASEAIDRSSHSVAIVTWQGTRRVLVEVGVRRGGRSEWRSRSLSFETIDDVAERWRSTGLVIGTLAQDQPEPTPGETEAPRSDARRPEPSPLVTPDQPTETREVEPREEPATGHSATRPPPPDRSTFELGGSVGEALGGPRFGGLFRVRFGLADQVRAVAAGRYLWRTDGQHDLSATWIVPSLGLDVPLRTGPIELSVGLDARAQRFRAEVRRELRADTEARWVLGAGGGVTLAWVPTTALGLFLGGDAAWVFGSTEVRAGGEPIATDERFQYAGEAGIRVGLR